MEEYFRNRASVDDPDLLQDRRRNDGRLKSRFEHIFAKYEKDFSGIGDEIDLESGEVVVNNGHLQSMRHEVDPGKGASSQLVRAFAHDLENESADDASDEDTGLEEEGSAGKPIVMDDDEADSSESKSSGYTSSGVLTDEEGGDKDDEDSTTSPMEPDELSSDFYQDETDSASNKGRSKRSKQADMTNGPHFTYELQGDVSTTTSTDTSRDPSPAMLLENMPFFKESMEAMQNHSKAGGPIDQEAIQALGKSIASQLAQFMSQGASKRNGRPAGPVQDKASPWNYPPLPMDKRQRTPTPPPPSLSSSAALFAASPGGGASLWAPQEHPRPRKKRRTKLRALAAASDDEDEIDPLQSDSPRPSPRPSPFNSEDMQIDPELEAPSRPTVRRSCYNCGETETAIFRTGPDGDLCNACGMYFYRYGLLRPPIQYEEPDSPPRPEPKPGTFSVLIPAGQGILQGEVDEFDIPTTPETGNGGGYAANTARRVVAGGARMTRFTVDEDESIIRLHEVEDLPWETIGRLVSGRSAAAVQCRYNKALKDQDTQARRRLLGKKIKVKQPQRPGEPPEVVQLDDEDDDVDNASPLLLTDDLRLLGELPMRDEPGLLDMDLKSVEKASRKAFNRNLNDPDHWAFKRFTPDEDQLILRLRNIDKLSWVQIQWHLPERTALALEKHYRNNLVPRHLQSTKDIDPALLDEEDGSKKLPFTAEEDQLITKMRDEENMSFAEMTDYLDGRSEQSLAIRYRRLTTSKGSGAHMGVIDPRLLGDGGYASAFLPSPVSQAFATASASAPATPYKTPCSAAGNALAGSLPVPQTPAAPISPAENPPRPTEVGPSAWDATQPASKGPLPFQPARKGPVPIASAPRWPVPSDPFVTKSIAVGTIMGPKKPGRTMQPVSASVLELVAKMSAKSGIQVWPSQVAHSAFVPGYHVGGTAPKKALVPAKSAVSSAPVDNRSLVHTQALKSAPTRVLGETQDDPMVHSGPFYTPIEDLLAPTGMCTVGTSTTEDKKTMIKASERTVLASPGTSIFPGPNEFSADDDRSIRKWREKDGLCWSDIAERLPGRTQQTVTDRYYDVIIGKQAESKAALLAARYDPNSLHGTRYTDEESEKVLLLRDQGFNWQEMADQMPGRTAVSIQNHFYGALMGPKRGKAAQAESTPSKPTQPNQPRAAAPLLRQALSNQTKRASLGTNAANAAQDKLAHYGMTPPPGKRALAPAPPMSILRPVQLPPRPKAKRARPQNPQSGAKLASRPSVQKVQQAVDLTKSDEPPLPAAQSAPRPALQQHSRSPSTPNYASDSMIDPVIAGHEPSQGLLMDTGSPMSAADSPPPAQTLRETTPVDATRRSQSVDFAPPAYPETPLRGGPYGDPYDRQATPDAGTIYESPARGAYQSMPYFIAPTAVMVTPSIENRFSEPPATGNESVERRLAEPFRSATPPVRNFAKPSGKGVLGNTGVRKSTSAVPKTRPSSIRKRLQDEVGASVGSPSLSVDEQIDVSHARKSTSAAARQRKRSRHRHKELVSEESAEESEPEEPPSTQHSPEQAKSRRKKRAPTLDRDSESDYQLDENSARPARRRTRGRSRRAPSTDEEDEAFEQMLEDEIMVEPLKSLSSGRVSSGSNAPAANMILDAGDGDASAKTPTSEQQKEEHSHSQADPIHAEDVDVAASTPPESYTTAPSLELLSVRAQMSHSTGEQARLDPTSVQTSRASSSDHGLKTPRAPKASESELQADGRNTGWPELITLALQSSQGKALKSTEVIEWIKDNFSYYKTRDISSKVRPILSARPEFIKVPLDQAVGKCKTAWGLAGPGDALASRANDITSDQKIIEHVTVDDDEDDELSSDLPVLPSPAMQRASMHGHPALIKDAEGEKEVISLITSDAPVPEPSAKPMQPPPWNHRAHSALPHGHPQNEVRRNSDVARPLPVPAALTERSASRRHSGQIKRLQQSPAPRVATPARSASKATPARAGTPGGRSSRAFTPRFEPIRRFSQTDAQYSRAGSVQVEFGRAGSVALPGGRRVLLAHGISAEEQEEEGADGVDELA